MSGQLGQQERREQMRKAFANLSTETLLDQVTDEADGFTPEAIELMRQELRDRGVSDEQIDRGRPGRLTSSRQRPDSGSLVAVATFEDRLFAVQARELLRSKDLEGWIDDRSSLGTHEFPIPDVEGEHVLLVDEDHAETARGLLADFAPAAGVDLSGSHSGEPSAPAE